MSETMEQAAAEFLWAERRARRRLSRLPDSVVLADVASGARAQRALAHLTDAMPPGGFKIGATAKVMQDYLGLPGPAAGFMAQRDLFESGVTLPFARFFSPGAECEIAVRLGRDLPPGPCTSEPAEAAVASISAAIELVELRYDDIAVLGTPALVADQVYHAAAIVGPPLDDWRGLDLASLEGRIEADDAPSFRGRGADLLGHPFNALAWLAGSEVAAVFGGLRAGQVVMLGSVTPPVWLERPGTVEVRFSSLAPVSVTLV